MRSLVIVSLLAIAGTATASPVRQVQPPVTIEVVDRYGSAFALFPLRQESTPSRQRAYLQAEPGAGYALRVTNHTPDRVGVVLAVDGRNVISGQRSDLGRSERMYVLGPWQSATYAGWRTGRSQVNEFYFTREADSYAVAFGDDSALGVIALAAYRERGRSPRRGHSHLEDASRQAPGAAAAAPSAAQRSTVDGHGLDNEAATGFGERRRSPSTQVKFDPERRALTRAFVRYAWRSTLCDWGVVACPEDGNRLWPASRVQRDDEFAQPPPGYRVRQNDARRRQQQ